MTDAVILRQQSVVTLVQGDPTPVVTQVQAPTVLIQRDGVPGIQGPQGPEGNGIQTTFVYNQASADTIWNISHNLGRFPSTTIVDNLGRELLAEVTYLDANLLSVAFDVPVSGTAYLN
jgi:hypothetical protein